MDNSHAFKENMYASLEIVIDIEERFFPAFLFISFISQEASYYYLTDNLTWLDHDKLTDTLCLGNFVEGYAYLQLSFPYHTWVT